MWAHCKIMKSDISISAQDGDGDGVVLGERETRRDMLYSGGDSDYIVHKVRLTLVTRTHHLD